MKKLLALALAVVMMMAIALPAFAADGAESTHVWGNTDDTDASAAPTQPDFDNVVLEYGVAQAYTVTIPADINFGYMNDVSDPYPYTDTRDVSVSDVVIAGNETLVITVVSANAWTMADTYGHSTAVSYNAQVDSRIAFNAKYDNNTDSVDPVVCTVMAVDAATGNIGIDPDNDTTVTMTFTTMGTAQEGLYRDTLTFTVDIEEDYNATTAFGAERTVA